MARPDIRCVAPDELASAAAEALTACLAEVIAGRGVYRFGLSGGSTPEQVYVLTARLPIEWEQVQVFWGDERCVPPGYEQSDNRMANEAQVASRHPKLPMGHVQPTPGRLVWFVDTDTASTLKGADS